MMGCIKDPKCKRRISQPTHLPVAEQLLSSSQIISGLFMNSLSLINLANSILPIISSDLAY